MAKNLHLLVVSHSSTRLNSIEDVFLDVPDISLVRKLINERSFDSVSDADETPDVVLLDLGDQWESDLTQIATAFPGDQAPLVVLGQANVPEMMRRSMQAGARDFFVSPIDEDELIRSIRRIGVESQLSRRQNFGKLTAVINGKGGAGGTVISSSMAAVLTGTSSEPKSVVAVDADLQFGVLPVYFDLPTKDSLSNALQVMDTLDAVAMEGFLEQHDSGVSLLSNQAVDIREPNNSDANNVHHLFTLLQSMHDHVVVDVPRRLDGFSTGILEIADRVVVVTQQSVPHVRDTRYLLGLLRLLGVPSNRICGLVNRYERSNDISIRDLSNALEDIDLHTVVNDTKRVSNAVNNGVLVPIKYPRARFTRDIVKFIQKYVVDAD